MKKVENKDICSKCGGKCCKKSGCDYYVSDFEQIKLETIEKALQGGAISIVAALDFTTLPNGNLSCTPILYLRARNQNREIIDLLSFKKTCASLTENGCKYDLEHRPSGGASLIPDESGLCRSNVDKEIEIKKWLPYQHILQRIVKRYTGKSVHAKLREDVEILFDDIFNERFEGVAKIELYDVLTMLPKLHQCFPEERARALKKYNNSLGPVRKLGL